MIDRFQQIKPTVLITVDGYRYNGKVFDCRETSSEIQRSLPSLKAIVHVPYLNAWQPSEELTHIINCDQLLGQNVPLTFTSVPFDHPLWVLYSSGTTGVTKDIVQSHGGILIEHLKDISLHLDLNLSLIHI